MIDLGVMHRHPVLYDKQLVVHGFDVLVHIMSPRIGVPEDRFPEGDVRRRYKLRRGCCHGPAVSRVPGTIVVQGRRGRGRHAYFCVGPGGPRRPICRYAGRVFRS